LSDECHTLVIRLNGRLKAQIEPVAAAELISQLAEGGGGLIHQSACVFGAVK
jgi:hypothetical protein